MTRSRWPAAVGRALLPAVCMLAASAAPLFCASAAFDYESESFWNRTYVIPENGMLYSIVVSSKDVSSVEAGLVHLLWKSGGKKVSEQGADPWGRPQVRGYPANVFFPNAGADWARCSYRGVWNLSPEKAPGVVRRIMDAGSLTSFNRSSLPVSYSPEEVAYKITHLEEEQKALLPESRSVPAIMGLLREELRLLHEHEARHAEYKKTSAIALCIKPE